MHKYKQTLWNSTEQLQTPPGIWAPLCHPTFLIHAPASVLRVGGVATGALLEVAGAGQQQLLRPEESAQQQHCKRRQASSVSRLRAFKLRVLCITSTELEEKPQVAVNYGSDIWFTVITFLVYFIICSEYLPRRETQTQRIVSAAAAETRGSEVSWLASHTQTKSSSCRPNWACLRLTCRDGVARRDGGLSGWMDGCPGGGRQRQRSGAQRHSASGCRAPGPRPHRLGSPCRGAPPTPPHDVTPQSREKLYSEHRTGRWETVLLLF